MKTGNQLLFLITCLFSLSINQVKTQVSFNRVPLFGENSRGFFVDMAQDQKGYMWIAGTSLYRYDGYHLVTYKNDPNNINSLAPSRLESICVDSKGMVWVGTFGSGLDRYDPFTGTFTHYPHNPNDPNSLSNNIVTSIIEDKAGTIWVGTHSGLNRLNQQTGKFTRYLKDYNDETTISNNQVRVLYQDRKGDIWVGCGSPYGNETPPGEGGLNRLDKNTGKFARFLHDPNNPLTLNDNKVRAICEDSRGTFWVGTFGDGLHILDRQKGTFTRLLSNPQKPGRLSAPLINGRAYGVNFIKEDKEGNIWIGSYFGGINRYDPKTSRLTHYEADVNGVNTLQENSVWNATFSNEGIMWITTQSNVYTVDPIMRQIEHIRTGGQVRSFLDDRNGIWIGSDTGLIYRNKQTGALQYYFNDPRDPNSLSRNLVFSIYKDKQGSLWVGSGNGLNLYNPQKNNFKTYTNDPNNPKTISEGTITSMVDDFKGLFWVGTETGLNLMNRQTGTFQHFRNIPGDSASLSNNAVYCLNQDKAGNIWVGTWNGGGVNLLNRSTGKFKQYLPGNNIFVLFQDSDGVNWAGTEFGLYRFNPDLNDFTLFTDPASEIGTSNIVSIVEDSKKNLWIGSLSGIYKINAARNETGIYGKKYGIKPNSIFDLPAYKTTDGEMLFGNSTGYYRFHPDSLLSNSKPPQLLITHLRISDETVKPAQRPLSQPIELTNEIKLSYKQNVFSFDFAGIHYVNPSENRHLYMLEGFEINWRRAGSEKTAAYFNVPPGEYVFKVKAATTEGIWVTKSIKVTVTPPWWQTWWAYVLFALLTAGSIWVIVHYRSLTLIREKRLLEYRVAKRTSEIKKQSHEIAKQRDDLEKAIVELKATQAQLIQSEKMASLGQLTAGIAHEIQNPLNFVNNFSEVNRELIDELENEIEKTHLPELKAIAHDIKKNEQKIIHHGKRADAIVKGMLLHARNSTGEKEPTDINDLADEYLHLSYHNFRAKDKSFNATFHTNFDKSIGKVLLVPQDISRVLLNLYNNAFYAASLPSKGGFNNSTPNNHQPTVWVTTTKLPPSGGGGAAISISVKDNGHGIPKNSLNKIFQPFYTTKPSGQGTGLGLSLSYDIIKAHGGELKVETKEGEGTEFIIVLPLNTKENFLEPGDESQM